MRASEMSSVPAMSRQRRSALKKRLLFIAAIVEAPQWGARGFAVNDRFYSGDDGFGLDLDAPLRVEQLFDGDHGGCGADVGEDLAVGTPDLLPVLGMGEVDARADNVLERGAGVVECGLDELEDGASLVGGGEIVGADRAGSGDVDDVADANGARETDDGLVGRCAGDVRAGHGVDVNQVRVGSLWRTEDDWGERRWHEGVRF